MLRLSALEPFAVGGTRRCYVHPMHPDRCIKVLREDRTPEVRRQLTNGFKRLLPLRHFDDQFKEQKAYDQIDVESESDVWEHVPEYFGTVETDMGIGIETKLFRNHDGTYPQNLEQLVPSGLTQPIENAINEFIAWLRRNLFLTRALLPHNIIAVSTDDDRYSLVIVDGIGNSEFIPISSYSKGFARRKVERKIRYFKYRIDLLRQK